MELITFISLLWAMYYLHFCGIEHCYLQQFPASATTLHFEYYEELDDGKAEKKVGFCCVLQVG